MPASGWTGVGATLLELRNNVCLAALDAWSQCDVFRGKLGTEGEPLVPPKQKFPSEAQSTPPRAAR